MRSTVCAHQPSANEASIDDDAADRFALMHELEAAVDLVERERMGDERVDLDLPLHVPVDDLGHVAASARAAESGAFPDAPSDQLERPRLDLLPRAGDANNHRH